MRLFRLNVLVGVDQGSGLIRSCRLTPAKVYESEVADALVLGDEQAVHADKTYEKHARRAALKVRGIKDRIQHRRSRTPRTLPYWQGVRNKLIGRIRTAVERTFSVLKGRYRLHRMRYRGLAANAFHFDLLAIAYNLSRCPRRYLTRHRRTAPSPLRSPARSAETVSIHDEETVSQRPRERE